MGKAGLYLTSGFLALITAFAGLDALASFRTDQPSNASILFMIGFTGLTIIVAIDTASRRK